MINDDNKKEIIEKYLKGTLSSELMEEVEARIQADSWFRHEVALHQRILQNVDEIKSTEGGYQELEGQKQYINELAARKKPVKHDIKSYAAALLVALMIGTGIVLWWNGRNPTSKIDYMTVSMPSGTEEMPPGVRDSIPVQKISSKIPYDFHYRFNDTLKLYGYFQQKELLLGYDPDKKEYQLKIDGRYYGLNKSEKILPLRP